MNNDNSETIQVQPLTEQISSHERWDKDFQGFPIKTLVFLAVVNFFTNSFCLFCIVANVACLVAGLVGLAQCTDKKARQNAARMCLFALSVPVVMFMLKMVLILSQSRY
jgi:hypothetical protein